MSDSCDCSPPAFSGHGIFQARILEWVAVSFSRWGGLPDPGIEPRSPALQSLYRLSHSGGPGGPWISRQNPVQAGDQRPTFDRVSGIPAAPAPGCRAPQDVHATCRGRLGQETKLVLRAFRCVATHSKARRASLETQWVKSLPAARESRIRALVSTILAWRIPRTVEPGGLQSMGSQESDTTERLTLPPFFFTHPGPALPYPQCGPRSPVPPPPLNSSELRGRPQTLQGGAILSVCRGRGSGPWGWGGARSPWQSQSKRGPPSGLLALSQSLFSRSCPKITPNCSPPPWHHLGSPTPDQRGKGHSLCFLGGSEPRKAASALGDQGASSCWPTPRELLGRARSGSPRGRSLLRRLPGCPAGQLRQGGCSPLS